MVSQDTIADSEGFAVDHLGVRLEDSVSAASLPQNFHDLDKDVDSSLQGQQLNEGCRTAPVVIVDEVLGNESTLSSDGLKNIDIKTLKAAYASNKQEREALFQARKKLQEISNFLLKKGSSFDDIEHECKTIAGMGGAVSTSFIGKRDEFGLPKLGCDSNIENTLKVLDDLSTKKVSDPGPSNTQLLNASAEAQKNSPGRENKSWSAIVKEAPIQASNVVFDYVPPPEGKKIVSPPVEILKLGNEKFKNCLVGVFTKGSKEEAFFDSNVWLDSDCEDDFMSVNGEFTPSRGNTPVHHNFTAGAPQVNKIVVTDRTPDAIHEPSPTDKKLRLCDLFEDSFRGDPNVDEQHTSAEMPCASSVQSSERTPSGSFKAKSLRSIQCCLPSLRSSNSFSERKMKASPVHSVA